jgi:hypothetical protein
MLRFFLCPILMFVVLGIAAPVALAQDDDPIRVDAALVRLNIGVVDGRGRPITQLNRTNFSVFEDGVKQDIARF